LTNILLKNAKVYTGEEYLNNSSILISNDEIIEIGSLTGVEGPFDQIIDCSDLGWVLPGMIDVHIHGANGTDVMDATQEALANMCAVLPKEGTTSFLATTMTHSVDHIESALTNIGEFLKQEMQDGAEILGVHLEGPFINVDKRGAQLKDHIQTPSIEKFKKWNHLAGDSIRLVTMAPEKDKDFVLIKYLTQNGVVVSMGHTNGTYQEITDAINNGVTHATHLFNGMSGIHHRDVGVAGAALLSDKVSVEMILDGHHLTSEIVNMTYRLKGPDRIILITDAMRAKCLVSGVYDLGGQKVNVKDGKPINEEGSLAGSVLKLKNGRDNFAKWVTNDIEVLTKITATNPAKQLGVYHRKGSLQKGKDADIILIDSNGEVLLSICRGKISHIDQSVKERFGIKA
jgi:N-acetylglucosamine-6-phosphate deacetylase